MVTVLGSCSGSVGGTGYTHTFAVELHNVAGQWYSGGTWTIPEDGLYKIEYYTYGHNCGITNQRFKKNGTSIGTPSSVTCTAGDTVGYDAYAWFDNNNQRGCCGVCFISGPFDE